MKQDHEIRNYDRSKVTNIFAIGEQIEWVLWVTESMPGSEDSEMLTVFQTGVIKEIYKWAVVLEIDGEERLVKKAYLENRADDPALAKVIVESLGWKYLNGKPSKDHEVFPGKIAKTWPSYDVYRLIDPRIKSVFYVGISKNSSIRYKQHLACTSRNLNLNLRIQEILQCGLTPEMVIIERGIPGQSKARQREKYWINYHTQQGDLLTNIAEMNEVE